jgi:lipopolysaccharide export LptBFGC system permease protein LptF
MRILDRYVIREFLRTYLIIFFSFAVVFIVIDVWTTCPRLIRNGATYPASHAVLPAAFALL